ncbi:DUF721 domain-containing protein [Aestuariivita boseongensis]|uniref:DUF721 domain-containing protein n=1 Tax=Aestuariivita boseongensis TaxID=1470562 RepID=UPI0006804672|nr:DciA family protein [Aestuariivita boseongensis]
MAQRPSTTKGFKRTATLLGDRIRKVGESRGFAVSRVLTHWAEIVGYETAAICRPVEVSYGRGGFGATLSILTTGAQAPMLEMQKEQIRARVNAVYGYNAIARVRITQTAKTGFAEGQATFLHAPDATDKRKPDPALQARARDATTEISNNDLRQALERLGQNVLTNAKE